jgi:hypothetical protein
MRVALLTSRVHAYSATFIEAHARRLPGDVLVLYGPDAPTVAATGTPVLPPVGMPGRIRRCVVRRVGCFHTTTTAATARAIATEIGVNMGAVPRFWRSVVRSACT